MILTLQQGGIALPPLVSYQPVTVTGGASAGVPIQQASSDETTDLTDKDLLKMLEKLDGLPSDMAVLTQTLQNFYIDQQYSPFPSTSNIASRYLQALNQMKMANFNHEVYKDALKTVSDNGGINEFALTDRGQLFCMNADGDFKLLSPEQLKENSDYQPLTNSELLYYRAQSPEMANNNEVLKVVKNGIGIKAVSDMIESVVSKLGTSEMVKEGYISRKNGQILNGLKLLEEAAMKGTVDQDMSVVSLDGMYKNKLLTKDQTVQAKAALNYIYQILPENAKSLLKIKSDGTNEGIMNMLTSLITSRLDNTVHFESDLQIGVNPDGTKKDAKTTGKEEELTPAQMFQLDRGIGTELVLNAGTSDALVVHASMMPVTKRTGDLQGVTTLDKVANDSQFGGLFNFGQVSVGDQLVDMSSLKNIVVNANQLYKAYLPIDEEKAANGIIAPNLNYLKSLEWVRNQIKERNAQTPDEINSIYAEARLPKFVDENGKVDERYYKPFGIMNASAFSEAFKKDANLKSDLFEEISDKNEANNVLSIISNGKNDIEWDPDDKWIFEGDYNSVVKSLVFLPLLSTDPTLGALSSGQGMSNSQYKDIQKALQEEQRQARLKSFKEEGEIGL